MLSLRRSMVWVGLLLLVGCLDRPVEPTAQQPQTPQQPTAQQLKSAQEAFAKLGARYEATTNPWGTKGTVHVFSLPTSSTDDALKRLPNPPFPFVLDLSATRVTGAGRRCARHR